jgi:hypothetical protein
MVFPRSQLFLLVQVGVFPIEKKKDLRSRIFFVCGGWKWD